MSERPPEVSGSKLKVFVNTAESEIINTHTVTIKGVFGTGSDFMRDASNSNIQFRISIVCGPDSVTLSEGAYRFTHLNDTQWVQTD